MRGSVGVAVIKVAFFDAMSMAKFPKIEYRLTELSLKETPKTATGPFTFDSKGELSLSGVTNKVAFPVTMTKTDKGLSTTGTTSVKMTSYGITPPGLIVAIKTGDDVTLVVVPAADRVQK